MEEERYGGWPYRAQSMIHLFNEETLRVRKIAGDMEREVLTTARSEEVVASDHAGHHKRRDFRIIALTDENPRSA
jgi:hypothetical protein